MNHQDPVSGTFSAMKSEHQRNRLSGAPRIPAGTSEGSQASRAPRGAKIAAHAVATAVARLIVLLMVLAAAQSAAAKIIHVAPSPAPDAGAGTTSTTESDPAEDGTDRHPYRSLARAVAAASDRSTSDPEEGTTIRLLPGLHVLEPQSLVEETCGNCEDPRTAVPLTAGVILSGRGLRLQGETEAAAGIGGPVSAEGGRSVIVTNAGYGIFLRDCEDCWVKDLVITGGARDTSGTATDAAIVVQRSTATIEGCEIRDNIGYPEVVGRTVVGIMGICGREDSRLRIRRNRILRNSWDGIALYRDAQAEIVDNVIDGVDLAAGGAVGGGRGVGIGVTWNARATIRGNLVRRYWKGIGLFVDARATVEENIVERIATWGLSLWDAGSGRPQGWFRGNAVDSTGACGAMIARTSEEGDAGGLIGNAFVRTGQNPKYDGGEPYCLQTAVARHAAPEAFRIEENLFCANREAAGASGSGDVDREEFRRRARILCARLAAWPSLRGSRFLAEYGGTP